MEQQPSQISNFELARANAEAVMARKLASHTIGSEDHSQFIDATVKINTGIHDGRLLREDPQYDDSLILTLEGSSIDKSPNEVRKALEQTLHDIPFIDELVRTGSLEDEIHDVKSALAKLQEAGADIPESVFKWAGFDTENEKNSETPNYMVDANANSYAVKINLNLPDHLPSGMTTDTIGNNIRERLDDIKDMLADRVVHYKGGDKDDIRKQIDELEFSIKNSGDNVTDNKVKTGNISIIIQSPEQKTAFETMSVQEMTKADSDPELAKTNILQSLDVLQLSKAVSRSLQTAGGDKATEIMPVIIGAKDVLHKIEKVLTSFKKEKPEFEHEVAEILNSNIFDRTNRWEKDNDSKFQKKGLYVYASMNKPSDMSGFRNRLTVEMAIPEGEAAKIIEKLSAMDPEAAAKAEQQQFATVDSIQLVGAYSPHPEVHQQLQTFMAPYAGQTFTVGQDTDKMKPFAEKLIGLVEKMHAEKTKAMEANTRGTDISASMANLLLDLEEAHQTIREGIKTGVKQAAPAYATAPAEAQKAYLNANPHPAEIPSSTMTPEWIQRLVHRTNDKGAVAFNS